MAKPDTRLDNSPQEGFASRQDAPLLARKIQRHVTRVIPSIRARLQSGRETVRRIRGGRHVVEFFHQVDDAYSQLAIQAVPELRDRYDIDFRFHLVGQTDRLHAPEPEMLADYARRDCGLVAPHYDLNFPSGASRPADASVRQVESILAGLTEDPRFPEIAIEAGRALWGGESASIERLMERVPLSSDSQISAALEAGNQLRKKRRHYSGALFWYAGEWYWGVDRLHHLERRLVGYGAAKGTQSELRFDRPALDPGSNSNNGRLKLEIFPSLRSPYSAMIFDRSLELAKQADIPVTLRPVMPMVMRGVPAPASKGIYIFLDTLREARHIGAPFGDMFDPIGRPVERGFSLWPFARDQGRGAEYLSAFLRAAFAEGRETGE